MASLLTAVTHRIPWFLRQPAEAIIGPACYNTLIYDVDLLDVPCLKYSLSKGLGLGIVLGGAIVKLPQIQKIVSTRSARGLSFTAYALETLGYAISLAYAARSGFPFSTYGENLFMTAQNIVITLLILLYAPTGAGRSRAVGTAAAVMAAVAYSLWDERVTSSSTLKVLQAATVPISLLSKAPQILSNHRLKSTGNLSAFAVFNALLGCLARIFTTLSELSDPVVLWGFILAAALNAVIALQMIAYWNNSGISAASSSSRASEGAVREKEERSTGMPTSPALGGGTTLKVGGKQD